MSRRLKINHQRVGDILPIGASEVLELKLTSPPGVAMPASAMRRRATRLAPPICPGLSDRGAGACSPGPRNSLHSAAVSELFGASIPPLARFLRQGCEQLARDLPYQSASSADVFGAMKREPAQAVWVSLGSPSRFRREPGLGRAGPTPVSKNPRYQEWSFAD